jgi:hypothetical protein
MREVENTLEEWYTQKCYEIGLQIGFHAVRSGRATEESLGQACIGKLVNLSARPRKGLDVHSGYKRFLHGRIEGARRASTYPYTLE